MEKNTDLIKNIENNFCKVAELFSRTFGNGKNKIVIFYMSGSCDEDKMGELIIQPINKSIKNINTFNLMNILNVSNISCSQDSSEVIDELSSGKCVVIQKNIAYICGIEKVPSRAIIEPPTSAVIRGPRSGFVETIKINIGLIRHLIKNNDLKSESLEVGKVTKTKINIMYLDNIVDKKNVKKIKDKINSITVDGIVDSNYVGQILEERPNSMFKQLGTSEKPDVIVSKLLEGRIAILVDGSPFVLTLPFILIEDLQDSDDYYTLNYRSTFLRIIRLLSIIITVYAAGLYLAVQLHHYKVIPLKFLITIINSTQGLPLTPFGEMLFVILLFEILYEASLRMPKHLGLALSIVGALILGDTAVKAGLISPPAVMIVAISGMSLYTIPEQHAQLSLLRLLFTFLGAFLGFYGIIIATVFFVAYLNDFDNYETPYLSPLAPFIQKDAKDCIIKADFTKLRTRPKSIKNINNTRCSTNNKKNNGVKK